ncbi:MAG: XRE family transcriptional regulator [Ilumatobacteraceae bacterium]
MSGNESPSASVGAEVRHLRHERGWTLDEAAERLGVSRRLLTQLEAGTANPSLSTLLSIAAGFDVALVDLLDGEEKPRVVVQPQNAAAQVLWSTAAGSEARLLVGSGALELWEWSLAPGDVRTSAAHRAGSREALSVTSGVVTVTVGSGAPVSVRARQSATFDADEPHSYANHGPRPALFVLAVHEPSRGRP